MPNIHLKKFVKRSAIFCGLILMPLAAFATDGDIGTLADTANASLESVPGFLGGMSYIMAAYFGVKTGLELKNHTDNPHQVPLKKPITKLGMTAGLVALGSFMDAGVSTLFSGQKADRSFADHGG